MKRFPVLAFGSLFFLGAATLSCNNSSAITVDSDGGAQTDGAGGSGAAAGKGGSGGGGTGGGTGGTGTGGTGTGGTGTGGTGGTGTGGTGTGGTGTGGTGGTSTSACADANPQCADGIDNDKDGKIDLADAECVGPCDNDEGSFATGIPGDNIDACKQDCFFDGNSGMGNDGCEWNLKCDPLSPGANAAKPCPYDATEKNCPKTQSDKCIKNCRSVTPNGCDCFGCCAVPSGNATVTLYLVAGCTAADFGNPMKCPRCTQSTACVNTCEKCEVCLGKPAPDPTCPSAPPVSRDGGVASPDGSAGTRDGGVGTPDAPAPRPPEPQCDTGVTSCGTGGDVVTCASGYFCLTGCCTRLIE